MIRPTVARVDLQAIESNLRSISAFLSQGRGSRIEDREASFGARPPALEPRPSIPGPRIIAVVKANAYGHGASEVGLALERAGAAMLACADIEEGIVLRRAGVRIPILVFGALGISDLEGVFEYDLTPTISTPSAAHALAAATRLRRSAASAGQARGGVRPGSDQGHPP
jgi:alanine racemase